MMYFALIVVSFCCIFVIRGGRGLRFDFGSRFGLGFCQPLPLGRVSFYLGFMLKREEERGKDERERDNAFFLFLCKKKI